MWQEYRDMPRRVGVIRKSQSRGWYRGKVNQTRGEERGGYGQGGSGVMRERQSRG